tara:strand:+ start:436 stop:822 length:387 start_codon:yes stop_codon:yes gene_type:complete
MKKLTIILTILLFISCSSNNDDGDDYGNSSNSGQESNSSDSSSSVINLSWTNGTTHNTTIKVGQTIKWTWGGGYHNLRSKSGGNEDFDSGYSGSTGFTFSYTFNSVGTTNYVCDPHESSMYGTVTVTE